MKFFQRLNYFKGLLTTAEDWQREQSYHVEKRQLQHRSFYTPGVVRGEAESLRVLPASDGKGLLVQPGYAIDSQGRDLYLAQPVLVPLPAGQGGAAEARVHYVILEWAEEPVDNRDNALNPSLRGNAFTEERPIARCTEEDPEKSGRIELARLKLKPGQLVTPEQIDISHVRYARAKDQGKLAARVQSGNAELNPSPNLQFSGDDLKFLIESFPSADAASGAIYLANAFPLFGPGSADARIFWRVESTVANDSRVQYYILLKNFGTKRVTVRYEVFRLNVGQML